MAEVLFILSAAGILAVLGVFVVRQRYPEHEQEFSPVEIEWLREEAQGRISALSSGVMELAEKERAVTRLLDGGLDRRSRLNAEELLVEAAAHDFWGRFVVALASVEEKPVQALEELGRLPGVLDKTIVKLEAAERLCVERRKV